ncbi:MAG: type II toxin-antitoxin system VapC family toxin [Actinobacteria bacterium]|nr:MAG: type II toxin-antitoxin system VapC family toxin [Actinomycetota bacterium]
MIVLDASAAIDYLVDGGERGDWVRERLPRGAGLAAPHVIDLEVVSGLRRLLACADVTRRQAENGLTDFGELHLTRYPMTIFLDRIWRLRTMLTPYDAAYVALGEALGSPLLTTDARLQAHGHRAAIVAFPG